VISSPGNETLRIAGPAGALEALLELPSGKPITGYAVICHPHPLHGGTMHNKVVHTLARALQELGCATLRFNYRGVGASFGSYADGIGETLDALAAVEYLRARFAGLPLTLAGFSFGGAVALRAAQSAAPMRLITVAPAVDRVSVDGLARPTGAWLIIQGDADEVVDAQHVRQWAARFVPPPQFALLPGVGHFFHGALAQLREQVLA
jgi:alpha/beta superfamily hydrolase